MSDEHMACEELHEFNVVDSGGETRIVRGTKFRENGTSLHILAGEQTVAVFYEPRGWYAAAKNKVLGFEQGYLDATSPSFLSRNGPHITPAYKRGWDAGFEAHPLKNRLAVALSPAPSTPEAGGAEIPEGAAQTQTAIPEGFIKWEGHGSYGTTPPEVDRNAIVEAVFADGAKHTDKACNFGWQYDPEDKLTAPASCIIAYRVIAEPAQTDAASDAPPADDTPRTLILDPLADPDLSSSDPLVSETGEGLEPDAELELTDVVRAEEAQPICDGFIARKFVMDGSETETHYGIDYLKTQAGLLEIRDVPEAQPAPTFTQPDWEEKVRNADPARDYWAMAPKAKEPV